METVIVNKIVEQLKVLPYEMQCRVFEFTRALVISKPRGVPGRQLLKFTGTKSPEDLKLMNQAIEENCEKVDLNEW